MASFSRAGDTLFEVPESPLETRDWLVAFVSEECPPVVAKPKSALVPRDRLP